MDARVYLLPDWLKYPKGQDERPSDALDSTRRRFRLLFSSIQQGRHVGLDFYDFLIEGGDTRSRFLPVNSAIRRKCDDGKFSRYGPTRIVTCPEFTKVLEPAPVLAFTTRIDTSPARVPDVATEQPEDITTTEPSVSRKISQRVPPRFRTGRKSSSDKLMPSSPLHRQLLEEDL